MIRPLTAKVAFFGLALALTACTNPNDPGQRAVGGGHGAAVGALVGGAVGAIGGAVTAPEPRRQPYYNQPPPGYYPPPRSY